MLLVRVLTVAYLEDVMGSLEEGVLWEVVDVHFDVEREALAQVGVLALLLAAEGAPLEAKLWWLLKLVW